MIPKNAHVTLYNGFELYSGTHHIFLGICTAGYFWTEKNRIGIRAPKYLNHELLGLLICKANNVTEEREDECEDLICYASPFSTNSGLCERHRRIVESKLAGVRIGLDVLIFPDSDLQKLKEELDERLEDFREKTNIDAYFNLIKTSKRKIRNGSWLIRKEDTEWILPPMKLDDVYQHKPTRIYSMHKIPSQDREKYEKRVEAHRTRIREKISKK